MILSEIARLNRGRVISGDFIRDNPGPYPVYSSQTENDGVMGYIDRYEYEGKYLTWTTDGANAGSVFYREGKFNMTNVCGLINPNTSLISTRFLYFFLQTITKKHVNSGMGNPKLMSNVMAKIPVPVPPHDVQDFIVDVLDRFDTLTSDLTQGLPAEIAARQRQYEHYRDQLLTFREKTA
jgi:type I restriction enzyme S subunit